MFRLKQLQRFLARNLFHKRNPHPKRASALLRVERLDDRLVPAKFDWNPLTHVLTVNMNGERGNLAVVTDNYPFNVQVCHNGKWWVGPKATEVRELRVIGTEYDDTISLANVSRKGFGTVDPIIKINALGGNDYVTGSQFRDIIQGGAGNDVIWGRDGDDQISGEDGNDQLYGEGGNDTVGGGLGHDIIRGGIGDDRLWGGDGDDTIVGDDGNDGLWGEAGNDKLQGGNGDDTLSGGAGNDELWGQAGIDVLWGGSGADIFHVLGDHKDTVKDFYSLERDVKVY
jgi:hypothetical protein